MSPNHLGIIIYEQHFQPTVSRRAAPSRQNPKSSSYFYAQQNAGNECNIWWEYEKNWGYLDGEDGTGVDDGVGSLARADLEADRGGEEVGRLLDHLRELPPVGGEELPVADPVPGSGAREREQDRRDAAVATLARRGARAGRLPRYSLDRVVV